MKTVDIQETNLDACVAAAQSDRVVVTRGGNPIRAGGGCSGPRRGTSRTRRQRRVLESDFRPPQGADYRPLVAGKEAGGVIGQIEDLRPLSDPVVRPIFAPIELPESAQRALLATSG